MNWIMKRLSAQFLEPPSSSSSVSNVSVYEPNRRVEWATLAQDLYNGTLHLPTNISRSVPTNELVYLGFKVSTIHMIILRFASTLFSVAASRLRTVIGGYIS